MNKAQASEQSIHRAKVSWEQSKGDLEMANSFIKTNPGTSCLLSNQSAINAFSSILQAQGHFQLPAYSSTEMLNLCGSVALEVEETRQQCEVLDSAMNRDLLDTLGQKISSSLLHLPKLCTKQVGKFTKLSEPTGCKTKTVFLFHDWLLVPKNCVNSTVV